MPNKTATAAKSETGIAGKNLLQLRICRTDGGIGRYSQSDPRRLQC